jgi:hypothetical protein
MSEDEKAPEVTLEDMLGSTVRLIRESSMISQRLDWDNPMIVSMADRSAMDLQRWRDQMSKDEYGMFLFAKAIHDVAMGAPDMAKAGYDVRTIMHIVNMVAVVPQIILEMMTEELPLDLMADLGIFDPEETV